MKAWVEISKQNLFHNLREIIKNIKPETRFMAILKSNAYGHGLREISKLLIQNLESEALNLKSRLWFGVDSVDEARVLQKIPGAKQIPTLILGYTHHKELKNLPQNTRLTIYNPETVKALSVINKHFKVHIKIETGTQRQGIGIKVIPRFLQEIKKYKDIEVEGISSHFAEAEDLSSVFTRRQHKIFCDAAVLAEKILKKKLIKHIACSAAASHFPPSQCDLVRVGINLYGLQSINARTKEPENKKIKLLDLKPMLRWKTIVAQVKDVKKRTPIGYGRSELMPYNGQIAILPVGYWDGYDRRLSGASEIIIGGRRCRIIGRVCMNMSMALLPPKLRAEPEDEVVLIGKQGREEISADELAHQLGTINYEVVTKINPLISRIIKP